MSDKNLKFNEKTLFVLSQKWCWGLILLVISMTFFFNTLMISFSPKQTTYIILTPGDWDAEKARPGLKQLRLPVDKVVVTDTGDAVDSCTTKVSLVLDRIMSIN